MGWLNTVLDVASVGLEVAQLGKLEQLRRQGITGNVVQAILQEIRNQIFNYKQSAEAILEAENKNIKIAAGAMRILELRLQNSGITADLFSELNDKEYVASTLKYIRDNSNRMRGLLPSSEVGELESMANAALRLSDYKDYLESRADYLNLQSAQQTFEELKFFSTPYIANGIGCLAVIFWFGFTAFCVNNFPNDASTGLIIGAVIAVAVSVWVRSQVRKSKNAKQRISDLSRKLDIEHLSSLDRELLGDERKAKKLQDEAVEEIERYFGDSSLFPSP